MNTLIDEKPHTVESLVEKYKFLEVNQEGAEISEYLSSKVLLHPTRNILIFVSIG